ncbi:helix-turn-helix transcriptional regulator [Thalassovita sp.]|uniref:helix-turn-helix transcriptional regulator n=1 Tax=Thalassovita sp. TaxID=1979401 RepID=UPI003B5AE9B5
MGEITNFRGESTPSESRSLGEDEVQSLIVRVGERVRKARERKGIPRRVLSENSGVSPRYLAQLEAGEGNISIGLLQRVAIALDHRIEWLMTEDDPWNSEALHVADLFRSANTDTRQRVMQLLRPESAQEMRAHRICLIGLRGAGKSTLGQRAGDTLGIPFVELNREIEEQSGMPVNEVMALYGQEGYRKLEAQAVSRVVQTHDTMILAVAGGIVAAPDTYTTLLNRFHTVWVKASPSEHMERVQAQGDTRPMAGNPEAMQELKAILTSREALYEKAQVSLDTTDKSFEQSLQELLDLIQDQKFLG